MSLTDIIESADILVDAAGNKKAVQLDFALWEELLTLLEDLEDAEEVRHARQEEDDEVPWEQVRADYLAAHPDADV